jgi:thiamine-phosphate pyrophosphorylase
MSSKGDAARLQLPPLYAILDIDGLRERLQNGCVPEPGRMGETGLNLSPSLNPALAGKRDATAAIEAAPESELLAAVLDFAAQLQAGGLRWLQYRAKRLPARNACAHAWALRQAFPGLKLIMNDRADLCLATDFDGVHVGQEDLWPEAVRGLIGSRIVGVSTHNPEQVAEAAASPADYVAIGPVFSTGSKLNPDPVVGLEGVRRARQLTAKPLVAIGGITVENCREVRAAGADSVAIISALLDRPRESAERLLRALA